MAFENERFSNIVNTLVEVSRRIRESTRRKVPFRPINHFYTFLPIKYVLVISCFIAMHCSCVSKNCNLMSLGLV